MLPALDHEELTFNQSVHNLLLIIGFSYNFGFHRYSKTRGVENTIYDHSYKEYNFKLNQPNNI